jgi:hypothetical protein
MQPARSASSISTAAGFARRAHGGAQFAAPAPQFAQDLGAAARRPFHDDDLELAGCRLCACAACIACWCGSRHRSRSASCCCAGFRDRSYWQGLRERFGFGPHRRRAEHLAARGIARRSVGRGADRQRAARGLSHDPVVVTTSTPTGRARALALFGARAIVRFLPYDLPGSVARFLDGCAPVQAIIMETELWPNLYRACARRNLPLLSRVRGCRKNRSPVTALRRLCSPACSRRTCALPRRPAPMRSVSRRSAPTRPHRRHRQREVRHRDRPRTSSNRDSRCASGTSACGPSGPPAAPTTARTSRCSRRMRGLRENPDRVADPRAAPSAALRRGRVAARARRLALRAPQRRRGGVAPTFRCCCSTPSASCWRSTAPRTSHSSAAASSTSAATICSSLPPEVAGADRPVGFQRQGNRGDARANGRCAPRRRCSAVGRGGLGAARRFARAPAHRRDCAARVETNRGSAQRLLKLIEAQCASVLSPEPGAASRRQRRLHEPLVDVPQGLLGQRARGLLQLEHVDHVVVAAAR